MGVSNEKNKKNKFFSFARDAFVTRQLYIYIYIYIYSRELELSAHTFNLNNSTTRDQKTGIRDTIRGVYADLLKTL